MKPAANEKDRNIYMYEPIHMHHSVKEEFERRINSLNGRLIKLAIKTRLFEKLNAEAPFLRKREIHLYNDSRFAFKDTIPEIVNYTQIKLNSIHFFEVLEIDEFEKFEKRILKLVKSEANRRTKLFVTATSLQDTKKKLASIKTSFDEISYGEFFSLSFKGKANKKFSLIEFLRFSYIKTNESYFIINLEITPSRLFYGYFERIVNSDSGFINHSHYHNIFSIIKGRWAEKYSTMSFLKGRNFKNLFQDLNYQAQTFLKENFAGVFLTASKKYYLPSLENFTVSSLEEFNKDRGLAEYFNKASTKIFTDDKRRIEVIFPRIEKELYTHNAIHVIHEIPNESNGKTSGLEHWTYRDMLESVITPWTLINILSFYWNNIAVLKRKVYDFIKKNSKHNYVNRFFRFFTTQQIIQLKYDLAKYRVIFARFEKEFNPDRLWVYTHHSDLTQFREKGSDKPEHNMLKYLQNRIKYQLKHLDGEIKTINENFTRIEEINSFRTNLFLQYASILLSLLALIFTFDKVKSFFSWIWQAIKVYL